MTPVRVLDCETGGPTDPEHHLPPPTEPGMNYLAQRRQTLLRGLKKDGLDAALVTTPVNVTSYP